MIRDESLTACIDEIVLTCVVAHIPPAVGPITSGIEQGLCQGFADQEYFDFERKIETLVRERVRLFLSGGNFDGTTN